MKGIGKREYGLSAILSSKTISRYIMTYLVIMIIPMFVSLFVFFSATSVLKEEVYNINHAQLANVSSAIGVKISLMDDIIIMKQFDPNLLYLLRNDNGSTDFILQRKYIADSLTASAASDSIIHSFFIYSVRQRYALSQSFVSNFDIFEKYRLEGNGVHIPELHRFLSEYHRRQFFYFPQPDGTMQPVYVSSIPYEPAKDVIGTFVFLVDRHYLDAVLDELNWNHDGALYLVDPRCNLIASSTEGGPDSCPASDADCWQQPFFMGESGGVEYAYLSLRDDVTGLGYLAVIPVDSFYEKPNTIRNLSLISFLLCLGIELALIAYFIKLNYNPLSKILSFFRAKDSGDPVRDEYNYLYTSLQNVMEQQSRLLSTDHENRLSMRDHALMELLLKSGAGREDMAAELEKLDIRLPHPCFTVALIHVEDGGILSDDKAEGSPSDPSALVDSVLNSVMADMLAPYHYCTVRNGDWVYIILNTDTENVSFAPGFMKISDFLGSYANVLLSVYISDTARGVESLHGCYRQCEELYENHDFGDSRSVFLYEEIPEFLYGNIRDCFPARTRNALMNCLANDRFDEARRLVSELIDSQRVGSAVIARYMAGALADILNEAMERHQGVKNPDTNEDFAAAVGGLLLCDSFEGLQKGFERAIGFWELPHPTQSVRSGALIRDVIRLIDQKYDDIDLNVSSVALDFGISQSYLSRLFRKKTGICMLDYINKQRVEAAKGLLRESSLTIADIAVRVGFSESNTFIRVFKRYEGITPKTYQSHIHREPAGRAGEKEGRRSGEA